MTASERAMAPEEWTELEAKDARIRELEAELFDAHTLLALYEAYSLAEVHERVREARIKHQAEAAAGAARSRGGTDEQQAPGPYEIVKVINGTWNVRDASTGDWVPDGVWLSKPDAMALAERLSGASREQRAQKEAE